MASTAGLLDDGEEIILERGVGLRGMWNAGVLRVTSKAIRFQFVYEKPDAQSDRIADMLLTIPYSDIEEIASSRKLMIFNVLTIVAKGGDEYPFWFGVTGSTAFARAIEKRMPLPQSSSERADRLAP